MPPRDTSDATPPPVQHNHESSHALLNDSFPAAPKGDAGVAKTTDSPTANGAAGGPGPVRDSGQEAAQNAKLGLPNLQIVDSTAGAPAAGGGDTGRQGMMENAQKTLADPKASAADKLSTVEKLAEGGVKNISVADADGKMRDYKIDVEKAGNRSMVQLYGKDDKGRDQVVLRGIDNGDGSFSQQKDRSGREVGFTGTNWNKTEHGQSTVGSVGRGGAGETAAPAERPRQTDTTGPSDRPRQTETPGQVDRPKQTETAPPKQSDAAPPAQRPITTDTTPPKQSDTTPPVEQPKKNDAPEAKPGSIDRSQFDSQLNDPRVMAAFAGRMKSEVGSQGKEAQVAFAEEVMNRAASRNQTLMQALSGSYYPTSRPGSSYNPEFKDSITKAWKEGTDTTHGATGNASGHVGFGVRGGHYDANKQWVSPNQTVRFGGERFGHEQVDINKGWLSKYESLKRPSSDRMS